MTNAQAVFHPRSTCTNGRTKNKILISILAAGLLPFCAFGEPAIAVKLRPPGQPALEVRLSEPTVVAVATRPEKWGFFQFPTLARWTDGTVAASWAMAADSIVSYGSSASGGAISKDEGKTWTRLTGEKGISGFLLPDSHFAAIASRNSGSVCGLKSSDTFSRNGRIQDQTRGRASKGKGLVTVLSIFSVHVVWNRGKRVAAAREARWAAPGDSDDAASGGLDLESPGAAQIGR